jgi:hypothetical protein
VVATGLPHAHGRSRGGGQRRGGGQAAAVVNSPRTSARGGGGGGGIVSGQPPELERGLLNGEDWASDGAILPVHATPGVTLPHLS